jgi:hypothetical protein
MIEGCRHHGVTQSHIDHLLEVESQPRKTPEMFLSLPVPEGTPELDEEWLGARSGADGKPICYAVNGKILEWTGPDEHTFTNVVKNPHVAGKRIEIFMSRMLFDIKYGTPATLSEFTREHAAYVEDISISSGSEFIKVVGVIPQQYKD